MGYENGLSVSTDDMYSSGQNTMKSSEEIRTSIADLDTKMNNLMSIWEGEAANALNTAYNNVKTDLSGFADMFDDLGAAIKVSAEQTAEAEADRTKINNFY